MSPRRAVLFGGQGSGTLFSSSTATAITNIVESYTSAAILLSKCHIEFLRDLSSLESHQLDQLGLEPSQFRTIAEFLVPTPNVHSHPVFESSTLCLYQLLRLAADLEGHTTSWDREEILETAGFCSGLIPATVLAASNSAESFMRFAVGAFRLSFWVGVEAALFSTRLVGKLEPDRPWAATVLGLSSDAIKSRIQAYNDQHGTAIQVSALCGRRVSLSGPGDDIRDISNFLSAECTVAPLPVHAWYHGGHALESVAGRIVDRARQLNINYPKAGDLVRPIRSARDASYYRCHDPDPYGLLGWVVEHILIHPVDWHQVTTSMSKTIDDHLRRSPETTFQIVSYGPSSKYLTEGFLTRTAQKSLEVADASVFKGSSSEASMSSQGSIAIVGMSVNVPGGNGPEQLWETLSSSLNAIEEIPISRFDVRAFYSPEHGDNARKMSTKFGAFLDDIWAFDNKFFNVSPREAKSMDPQQRLLLHAAQHALDDAGYVPDSTPSWQRATMGCYVGAATGDYTDNLRNDIDVFYSPGTLRAFLSGRLSYVYKFSGPSVVVDTACSSSLVAIYQACRALQAGDCSAAIAGGVNAICSPDMYLGLARGHFLSATGGCKSFDEAADGYCRAEGCAVFVLKRLSDAIAEKDRIHAIIRGVEINQSGNSHSITHPHSETQTALSRQLLKRANIPPATVNVVEAHGTGTQAGDTKEIASIQAVFGGSHSAANPLHVSSIKGNIGHCEAASGAAALAKLILMMRAKRIPPQANLRNLNLKLVGQLGSGILITDKMIQWQPSSRSPRRALLNNFGAAGSNAALLLEEAEAFGHSDATETASPWPSYVFNLSAKSRDALSRQIVAYGHFLSNDGANATPLDIFYGSTTRRQVYDYRISIQFSSIEDLRSSLSTTDVSSLLPAKKKSKVVFVFSGQGGTHPGMGADLLQTLTEFRNIIDDADAYLLSLGFESILPYITGSLRSEDGIISNCACIALQYAIARLMMRMNIQPDVLIGHSLGEYAALAISGAISFHECLRIVALRAKFMEKLCSPGASGMVACKLSALQAEEMMSHKTLRRLVVACRNGPSDTVVAGPLDQLQSFQERCTERGVKTRQLGVPFAYHSPEIEPISTALSGCARSVEWSKPAIPIMSTVFGRMLERSDLTDEYPFRHARQPVLFERSIQELRQMGMLDSALCLEIGPHPITLPAIRGSFSDEAVTCIPTLQKSRPAWVALSSSLGQISLIRDDILWRELFHSTSARFIDLPKYLLQGTPFKVAYQEPSQTPLPEPELSSCDSAYPLLAGPLNVSDDISEFKTSMRLLGPLISGHNVGGSPICPASVYHELVLEAVASLQVSTEGKVLEVKDMVFSQPLVLGAIGESEAILVRTVKRDRGAAFEFSIYCQEPADKYRSVYCTGMVMARPSAELGNRWLKDAVIVQRQTAYMDKSSIPLNSFNTKVLYESVFTRVVRYSSDYHTLQELRVSDSSLEGIGTFLLPPDANRGRYVVPPVFTDTLLHTAGFIANLIIGSEEICICSHVQSIDILRSDEMDCSQRFTIYCSLVDVIKGLIVADVVVLEEQGRVVAKATGLEFKKLRLSSFLAMLNRSKPETATKVVERAGATLVEAETPNASSMSLHRNRQTSLKEPNQKRLSVRETLLKVISSVSGLEESDLLDQYLSLETLGIDSMMHIELADKLRKAFPGVNLSHEEFSQNETIHALEQALASLLGRDSGDSTSSTPFPRGTPSSTGTPSSSTSVDEGPPRLAPRLRPLHVGPKSNTNTPLCVFHDGSGLVTMYSKIQNADRDIYGFTDPYLLEDDGGFKSLEDMAAAYCSQIVEANIRRVILGGWSFGGIVALEAALQLSRMDVEIEGLLLIDSPFPIGHSPLPDAVISHATSSSEKSFGTSSTTKVLRREFKRNAALLGKYHPRLDQLKGMRVVMLKSKDVIDTEKKCGVDYPWLSSQQTRNEAVMKWNVIFKDGMLVIDIPGNHFEAFESDNIYALSEEIVRACQSFRLA